MISASLGAHYSFRFVLLSIRLFWQTLIGSFFSNKSSTATINQLKKQLADKFNGQVVLTYKGRDAIQVALTSHSFVKSNDIILTQAFTCYAIEEAIIRAGAKPGFVDVGKGQVNLTVETLQRGFERCNQENQHVRAVIVQHSLGHPAEIAEIKHWCDKRKLILIEDLAQGFGATASDGDKPKPLGSFADTIILSFGRDKVIDAVSGGAVIFREPSSPLPTLSSPPTPAVLKDLAYPFWTWLIRATYSIGLGKIIHKMLTIMGLMTNPTASPTTQATALPASLAKLALSQLQNFNQAHQHRQKIAALYLKNLSETPLQLITQTTDLDRASLLRLAATTDNPQSLLNFLKHHQIHLTDRWYRSPVDCGKLNCATNYQSGSCPRAKQLANTIINLPTHQKISIADAQKIIDLIKKYFEKQKK